jgi:hypothetical protein
VGREHTSISIAGEIAGPLDISGAFELTGSDAITADGRKNRRVGESRLSRDDTVSDKMVDGLGFSLVD